jgi:hypothetical protein
MLPQSSSTSSSERFDWRDLFAVGAWFAGFLLLFELGAWILFTHSPLSRSSLRNYLWYGVSYESKLRELVNTPNLPSNSILYAGWLGDGRFERMPNDVDVTVYGMSFSMNLAKAMKELRGQQTQRLVGGPDAPMGAVYGYYQADHSHRKTRHAIIGATSGAVEEVGLMNLGSLHSDFAFPYFFPRYEIAGDGVKRVSDSLINSADELRTALDDHDLWERQLSVLAAHDSSYRRFFFAHDIFDYSVIGRFVRRGMSKRHAAEFRNSVLGPGGFKMSSEAPNLFRALMRQMIRDLKAEHVQPIVALFSLQGHGNYLYDLVADILSEEEAPFVNTNDYCPSNNRSFYLRDMHFIHDCDLKFAGRVHEIMDSLDARTGAQAPNGP